MKSVYDLISLANKLDKLGLIREADLLDHTIKVASSFSDTLEAEINRVDKKKQGRNLLLEILMKKR